MHRISIMMPNTIHDYTMYYSNGRWTRNIIDENDTERICCTFMKFLTGTSDANEHCSLNNSRCSCTNIYEDFFSFVNSLCSCNGLFTEQSLYEHEQVVHGNCSKPWNFILELTQSYLNFSEKKFALKFF